MTEQVQLSEVERRGSQRFEMATTGQIILMSGARISFNIEDISERGARLRLSKMVVLTSEFLIDIFSPCRTKVKRCNVRRTWQKHGVVGVKFVTSNVIELEEPLA